MKKTARIVVGIGMASTVLVTTGCFGKFSLVRKVYEFNDSLGGDDMPGKFVKTLVMWAMYVIPIYELSTFVDLIILNLIEFWTGTNPLAMHEGQIETQIVKKDGVEYIITATYNKFEVTQLTGAKKGTTQSISFNPTELAWYNTTNGDNNKIIQYSYEGGVMSTITYFTPNHQSIVLDANTLTRIYNDVAVK